MIIKRLLMAMTLCCTVAFAAPAMLDKIVAVVNDDIITQKQLQIEMQILRGQLQQTQQPVPADNALQQMALDQLINFNLQLQLAKTNNITVGNAEIDKAIARIATQNKMSVENFKTQLTASGIDYRTYRERIQQQLTVSKVQQGALQSKLKLEQAEIKHYLQQHPNLNPKSYHVQDLLIATDEHTSAASLAEKQQNATAILRQLTSEMELSEGLNYVTNKAEARIVDLDWRAVSELPTAFAARIQKMQIGQVIGPIKTDNGLHILKLVGVRSANSLTPADQEKQAANMLYQEKLKKEMVTWMKEIRAQSYVKVMS